MEKREVLRISGVVFLLAFGVFATLSLLTYDPHDQRDEPLNAQARNFCGRGGALASEGLYITFGRTAIAIPLFSALCGFEILRKGRLKSPHLHVTGAVLFLLSAAAILNFWDAGGVVGKLFHERFLAGLLPPFAAKLMALFLFFISLLLLTEMRLMRWIRAFVAAIHYQLYSRVRQIQQEVEVEEQPVVGLPAQREPAPEALLAAPETPDEAVPSEGDEAPAELEHQPYIPEPEPDEEFDTEPETPRRSSAKPEPDAPSPIVARQEPEPRRRAAVRPEPPPPPPPPKKDLLPFELPPLDLLERYIPMDLSQQEHVIKEKAIILENTLKQFNIEARVVEIQRGPVITQYELSLAPGIKVQRIISLSDDIAMAAKAPSVRIVAPIPGKSTVGIEVPNTNRELVRFRELLETYQSMHRNQIIPLMLGKDAAGVPLFSDLAQMPHLLIAGATGSGKSVCVNSIILSLMMTKSPEDVKLLLVDPKMVEFACFKDIPHLMSPVVTDMKRAASVLEWACLKMDDRYALFSRAGARNISVFNQLGEKEITRRLTEGDKDATLDDVPFYLPHIVIVVDELADLMMIASKEVESSITRLSQKSRAVGIHLILATQRPSVDVITGLIKANLPSRISFKVASKIDSGVILDQRGAEKLLGMGDMLFLPPGTSRLVRAQGAYVSDGELAAVTDFIRKQREPDYDRELAQYRVASKKSPEEQDILYPEAVRIVLESQRGSVSLLQRRLEIGYSRAARLIDMMADDGIVGEYKGSQARDILMTLEEWEQLQEAAEPGEET